MTQTTTRNYKQTLNLPRTDFPMRANLAQNEPQSIKRWEEARLYEQAVAGREKSDQQPFIFHDGPPYTSGSIHLGHLLNKVLKDFVVRFNLMRGRKCEFIPGWDCHGLPIEHRVMTEMVESGKVAKLESLPDDQRRMAIRRECAKYAEKHFKLQKTQMIRLLTLADYEHPYLTMQPEYEAGVLQVFASLLEKGLVYRALKPVHWSIANQTALAEAELEYEEREDPSIYVDFEVAPSSRERVGGAFGVELDQTPSLMIWTTTPWTLPANLAIAVHPRYRYSLVQVDGNVTVIASDLVERVTKTAKAEDVQVLGECDGAALVGIRYRHPFIDPTSDGTGPADILKSHHGRMLKDDSDLLNIFTVVEAEYVTLEDGTGLVHTAPGHGQEDYQSGIRERLPIYCPVRGDGTFDKSAPDWLRGISVWDANEKIVTHLRESGHLFYSHRFTHSYPHDWRGKSPVIFRATAQWFISVDREFDLPNDTPLLRNHSLRERAMIAVSGEYPNLAKIALQFGQEAIIPTEDQQQFIDRHREHLVRFFPEWGRNRMRGMLESRPDWCLSRQRAWGLPIPAFYGPVSGGPGDEWVLLTPASVRAVARFIKEKGSNVWFESTAAELLKYYDPDSDPYVPPWFKKHYADEDRALWQIQKSNDIFDVWFESGSSWHAVMRQRDLGYPCDLYLEGSDQHRGWFQTSLLPALGVTGKPPYRDVVTHGFVVDKDGKKMSKSIGNTIEVEDLLKDFGADVARWWVASMPYENDIKADLAFFETAGESYRKVRNTMRFLLSNLFDYEPADFDFASLPGTSLDAYVITEAANVQARVMEAFENYQFRKGHQVLYDFCNDTLSAFYCAAVKDRLYCDRADSTRRRATQATMHEIARMLCTLLAPIAPHTADEAWRSLMRDESACVHLETVRPLPQVQAESDWPKALEVRDAALKAMEDAKAKGIENPLDAEVVLPDPDGFLAKFQADLPDMLGVSRVKLVSSGDIAINDLRNEPRCERSWKRDGTVKQRSDGGMLTDRDAEAVGVA